MHCFLPLACLRSAHGLTIGVWFIKESKCGEALNDVVLDGVIHLFKAVMAVVGVWCR